MFALLRGASGVAGAFAVATASSIAPSTASAHVVVQPREARPDSFVRAVFQVTHGCSGSPTRSVTVTIPDGVVGARPMAKPGWTIATVRGAYDRAYPFVHGEIREGVREVTWSGGSLPDDQFDEFTVQAKLTDGIRPGQRVFFPVEQRCETGAYHWVQVPAAGQDAHALAEPAPSLLVVAADGPATTGATGPANSAAEIKAGDLVIRAPWMRATPNGASVAGGYVTVTNTGREPDRLVSTSIPIAATGEVHEMSTEGGVMKMRPVEGGLAIPPGGTVELKPGGYHLMFTGLKSPAREGDTVKGTLVFARAGTVEVTFQVRGLGAQSSGGGGHSHH